MSNGLLLWLLCLSCKVVLIDCEVVLVNRNVSDSFRVGKDGCTNDTSVCPSSSTCHTDSGLCLCVGTKPSFRNPTEVSDGDKVYGCLSNQKIRAGFGQYTYYIVNEHLTVTFELHSSLSVIFLFHGHLTWQTPYIIVYRLPVRADVFST